MASIDNNSDVKEYYNNLYNDYQKFCSDVYDKLDTGMVYIDDYLDKVYEYVDKIEHAEDKFNYILKYYCNSENNALHIQDLVDDCREMNTDNDGAIHQSFFTNSLMDLVYDVLTDVTDTLNAIYGL